MISYKQDDDDTVDGILDKIKQAKNNLISFTKQAAANEDVNQIGKELFKLIFEIIKDSIEDNYDLHRYNFF